MDEEGADGVALGARRGGAAVRREGGAGARHGGGWWGVLRPRGGSSRGEEGRAGGLAARGRGASGRLGSQWGPELVIPCRERDLRETPHHIKGGDLSYI
jgi:hypothetical protein